jgi:hypothetical protein
MAQVRWTVGPTARARAMWAIAIALVFFGCQPPKQPEVQSVSEAPALGNCYYDFQDHPSETADACASHCKPAGPAQFGMRECGWFPYPPSH